MVEGRVWVDRGVKYGCQGDRSDRASSFPVTSGFCLALVPSSSLPGVVFFLFGFGFGLRVESFSGELRSPWGQSAPRVPLFLGVSMHHMIIFHKSNFQILIYDYVIGISL